MNIVTEHNRVSKADVLVAYALEGRQCVYLANDSRDFHRFKTWIESHLDTIKDRVANVSISFANGRYTVDSQGRKGYILLVKNIRQAQGNQYSEVFVDEEVPDEIKSQLESMKNSEVRGHGGEGIRRQSFRG